MRKETAGFFLGLILAALILLLPPPDSFVRAAESMLAVPPSGMDAVSLASSMRSVAAVMVLMVVWWVTEALPLPATALVPAVLLPLLRVVGYHQGKVVQFTLGTVAVNYANPVIFLFLGGFLLAGAMHKWNLDRRLVLWLLSRGTLANNARHVLLALMGVTAFLSMWVSNTATTALMLPVGIGILSLMGSKPGESKYGTAIMLGIAWAASIGGIGTIIGTPPNGIALGILSTTLGDDPSFRRITFLDWMAFGVPYVVLFLPVAWGVLLKLFPPETTTITGGKKRMLQEYVALGPLSRGETVTIAVFLLAACLWIVLPFRDQLLPVFLSSTFSWFDEYTVGLLAGLLLFLLPVDLKGGKFAMEWSDTKSVEWGVLILFGGGIALSDAMFKSGLAAWIATSFISLFGSPSTLVMMIIVILLIDFLTEITSNTAVASMMVPVVISIARVSGGNPVALALSVAVASSLAFMLPVATPPNAMVFSTGYVRLRDMVKAGFILDILGWLFTVFILAVLANLVLGMITL